MAKKLSTESIIAEAMLHVDGDIDLTEINKLTKSMVKKTMHLDNVSRQEIRFIVDQYYQMQDFRKAITEQIRSLNSGADKGLENDKNSSEGILKYLLGVFTIAEESISNALQIVAESNEVGRWLLNTYGIGPVLACGLLAYFDVEGRHYASQFISYGGLNDNNRPWLGKEKAQKIVNEVIKELSGIDDSDNDEVDIESDEDYMALEASTKSKKKKSTKAVEITDAMVVEIAARTQWSYEYLLNKAFDQEKQKWSKDKIIKACSIPPYNKKAKTLLWKVGDSFNWLKRNPNSQYGRLLAERLIYETERNNNGEFADQAAAILASKNIGKSTEAYKWYSEGKLPPAHLTARAYRWVEKIFLSHLFEEMYRVRYNKVPARYYTLEHLDGHHKEIDPEVPYTRTSDPNDVVTEPFKANEDLIYYKDQKSKSFLDFVADISAKIAKKAEDAAKKSADKKAEKK